MVHHVLFCAAEGESVVGEAGGVPLAEVAVGPSGFPEEDGVIGGGFEGSGEVCFKSEERFVKVWGARLSELGAWLRAESEHSAC